MISVSCGLVQALTVSHRQCLRVECSICSGALSLRESNRLDLALWGFAEGEACPVCFARLEDEPSKARGRAWRASLARREAEADRPGVTYCAPGASGLPFDLI